MKNVFATSLVLIVIVTGCTIGGKVKHFPPAFSGAGAIGKVELAKRTIEGAELIAINDSSIVIIAPDENLLFFKYESILGATFGNQGMKTSIHRQKPNEFWLERLRLISRYPQGLNDRLLKQLLDAYGIGYDSM